jgi:hypothetical protein
MCDALLAGIGFLAEAAEARMALDKEFDVKEYVQRASTICALLPVSASIA